MLKTLLESARPHKVPLGSLVASVGVHILLSVPALQPEATGVQDVPESFITRALFLPPPDRRPAAPRAERLDWVALGAMAGREVLVPDAALTAALAGNRGLGRRADEDQAIATDAVPAQDLLVGTDTAYSVFQVDETVTRFANSGGPMYPNDLLAQRIEGVVYMRYIVDATGSADTASARVVRSTHPQFTRSVLAALAEMRFNPATIDSRPVAQLVEQEFSFRIQAPEVAAPAPKPATRNGRFTP